MAEFRVATAVLLTRGGSEVYLVLRAAGLRFFGGYWAFPGGVIDPCDRDEAGEGGAQHLRCALRELFEETGVLVAPLAAALGLDERAELRAGLLRGEQEAGRRWRAALDRTPAALAAVRPFGRVTTPEFAPVRYRTTFVQIELPEGELPQVDEEELEAGDFFRPGDALAGWIEGVRLIVPPALFLLGILRAGRLEDVLARASAECAALEAGRLHDIQNAPGIWMLPLATPTIPPATTTNAFLIGEEELWLLDPATYEESERARLYEFLERRLSEGRRLVGVIASHHHPDHIGSVRAVAERYGLEVRGHPRTLERLGYEPARARALHDLERIELGRAPDGTPDWALVAYHTPGHDQGHLAFVDTRYRACLAGDLVSTLSTIVIDPPEGHLATYLASLRRMLAVPLALLHPAHGPVARDGHALLRHYLAHRAEREQRLCAALSPIPQSLSDLLPQVYGDTDRALWPLAERSLLAGLEKLREEGRARSQAHAWSAGEPGRARGEASGPG